MSPSMLRPLSGALPELSFEQFMAEGINAACLSRETQTLFVATRSGRMCRLSPEGERLREASGFAGVRLLQAADNGAAGIAVCDDRELRCFDNQLELWWEARVTGRVTAVAAAPYASHFAFATDGSRIHVVTSERKEVTTIECRRPIEHLHFLAERPAIIAASEYGELSCYSMTGELEWTDGMVGNSGMTAVAEAGNRLIIAAFNHGVQVRDLSGEQLGMFAIDGIPGAVACSSLRERVVVQTLEGRLFCLSFSGAVLWVAQLLEPDLNGMFVSAVGNELTLTWESGAICQYLLN